MMGAGLSPSLLTAPQDLAEGGPRSSPPAHQAPAALAAGPKPHGSPERPGCLAMGSETSVSGSTYTSGPF